MNKYLHEFDVVHNFQTHARGIGIFLGARANQEMPGLLSSGDLAIFPSLMEATSIAALEAMSCELPVAASRVGGLPEIVSETEDGYKAIAYQSLTAVLIEAMKEQQQQITAQQDQITALEKENQYLKSIMAEQMDALLARVTMLEGVQVAAK